MEEPEAAPADPETILKQSRRRVRKAKDALNFVAQREFAAIAADYIRRGAKLTDHPAMAALVEDDLLHLHVFSQKTGPIMNFYRHLLAGVGAPKAIFEIGVKNGGSLAMWRNLFPQARIVGLDLKLSKAVRQEGVIYLEGDQTDTVLLAKIAEQHGPFDLIIDDGSHVGEHQLTSLEALAPHVADGGAYVIEDIHTSLKPDRGADYGDDVWADFVAYMLYRMRRHRSVPDEKGAVLQALPRSVQLAVGLAVRTAEVILAHHTLGLRFRDRWEPIGADVRLVEAAAD